MFRSFGLSLLVLGACHKNADVKVSAAASDVLTLVATAELRGTTEPCGCNSDPLGDLARVLPMVKGGFLLDAGDLTYPVDPVTGTARTQADLKAKAIADIYKDADIALGPSDSVGPLAPPRQACNVATMLSPRIREYYGLKVGIFGVSDPARVKGATDPVAAATKAVATLNAQGAQLVVGLLAMNRSAAHDLMTSVQGIDFGIAGLDVEEGMPEAEPIGTGWLVSPADQGRRVARLVVHAATAIGRLKLSLYDDGARTITRDDKRIKELGVQLDAWAKDKSADPKFVAARRDEQAKLTVERDALMKTPPAPPAGAYFTYTLIDVKRALPRDEAIAKRLRELDHAIGQANLAAAVSDTTPELGPEAGKDLPKYVGQAQCVKCHKPAVDFWQKTRHAHAWQTLVDVDKQYNYDCIGCHVTGWHEAGGSSLGTVEKLGLTNVQCEMCHGAGSKHVAEAGLDDPSTMHVPAADFCAGRCHTKEHSDTFALEPYLRDILGPGHGEKRRAALGDGPTGHELRQAALAKAK